MAFKIKDGIRVGTTDVFNNSGTLLVNAPTATKLATARNINGVPFDGTGNITISAAAAQALTIGTGLSGTSYDGSTAVTIAIDSSVVTLTGTQTLTNKTLTSPKINLTLNPQTGTSYTLDATDSGKLVTLSNAGAITLTVPSSVFSAGEQINIAQTGAGQVTLAQGSGVTINSNGATATAPAIRAQYSAATIICTASDTFLVIGDIA